MTRGFSSLSLGNDKKKNKSNDPPDDNSVTTFATEAPLKYNEASKLHRFKVQRPLLPRGSKKKIEPKEERSIEDSNVDAAPHEEPREHDEFTTRMQRTSSFSGLKQKMENLTQKAFQRRNQWSRENSLLDDHDSVTTRSDKPDPQGNKNAERSLTKKQADSTIVTDQFLETLGHSLSMDSDRQDELLASFLDGTAGCVTTEAQLQSRLLMESMASRLNAMSRQAKSIHREQVQRPSLSDEAAGFLNVLSHEMKVSSPQMPRGQDDLVLFLGDELEASTCGRPQITDGLGRFLYTYDFNDQDESGNSANSRRLVPIKEGGAVEEMLESIELGYEASLIGCGLAQ
jgi:hypothetical protein